jgi:hypothetical protein
MILFEVFHLLVVEKFSCKLNTSSTTYKLLQFNNPDSIGAICFVLLHKAVYDMPSLADFFYSS